MVYKDHLVRLRLFIFIRTLFKSPFALFVYSILSKWYVLVTVTSIVVTYWIFKGLGDSGVLSIIESTLLKSFNEIKAVAKYCTKHISNLPDFWECVKNIPEYLETEEEKDLMEIMQNQLDIQHKETTNPYKVKDCNLE